MAFARACACVLALLAWTSYAGKLRASLRTEGNTSSGLAEEAGSFIRSVAFDRRLRVCNAYPYDVALDVYKGPMKLTIDKPLPYKSCEDFPAKLEIDDKLDFKMGDADAGTFSITDLPESDAVLLLVVHRHDTVSTSVAFESHVFADLKNAQLAVIDAYKGPAKSMPKISDAKVIGNRTKRSEEVRYDSVVALNPGFYEVELFGNDTGKSKATLVANEHESYVVLRVGVDAREGPSYPEELVVYPHFDSVRSGSMTKSGLSLASFAASLSLAMSYSL
eukprot:TRINITY_DN49301_c0_g1_i1.p1 TRINITY_DN49301_c0_g1~~TRINITY_DN49301_c0_g1_i1.p1  ORF type:complete len:277 (+),score=36.28 TRINITY_DN49301_c0_g1_i1:122-952(+)